MGREMFAGSSLDPSAFKNAYELLSQLYLHPLNEELNQYIKAIPELWHGLGTPYDDIATDNNAAEHYHLFGLNVFPFESVFIEPSCVIGGVVSEQVASFYHKIGFEVSPFRESPDHIGVELEALAYLCLSEADALSRDLNDLAVRIKYLQANFLDEHLLIWLPVFINAVQQQQSLFYKNLAELTFDVILFHRETLDKHLDAEFYKFDLPPVPDILETSLTGVKEIGSYLLTPVYSGLYISKDEIIGLARKHNLSRGFGDRKVMLANLIHSASDYGKLQDLLEELLSLVRVWQSGYENYHDSISPVSLIAKKWLDRLHITSKMICEMKAFKPLGERD
jgi:TorA maturation chaperone TorD